MAQYIDKAALVAEIERRTTNIKGYCLRKGHDARFDVVPEQLSYILAFVDTLEVRDVDLEIFGAIARHVIAVKEHVEDMRFDKEEWLTLEKIGYPERFKARKQE